jgi:hypothetical protein
MSSRIPFHCHPERGFCGGICCSSSPSLELLPRMCQKLRQGDMAKFIQEIEMEELPEDQV